jgi:hypothetical protein
LALTVAPFNVTVLGDTVHAPPVYPLQLSETVPTKPAMGVSTSLYWAFWLPFTVFDAGETPIEKSVTLWIKPAEVLGL